MQANNPSELTQIGAFGQSRTFVARLVTGSGWLLLSLGIMEQNPI
jgi:hypothetical protein